MFLKIKSYWNLKTLIIQFNFFVLFFLFNNLYSQPLPDPDLKDLKHGLLRKILRNFGFL